MTTIVCDFTKKAIPNAQRDVNYNTVLDKTLSKPAMEELEKRVRERMAKNRSYVYKDYQKILRETLHQMCK